MFIATDGEFVGARMLQDYINPAIHLTQKKERLATRASPLSFYEIFHGVIGSWGRLTTTRDMGQGTRDMLGNGFVFNVTCHVSLVPCHV